MFDKKNPPYSMGSGDPQQTKWGVGPKEHAKHE